MADTPFRLGLYETLPILKPTVLGPGIHTFKIMPAGNSLLATIWVKSIVGGSTLQATWYDYAVGSDEEPGAKYTLETGPILATPTVRRDVITEIHNQVYVDLVVVGGTSVEVALIASVVTDFPVELNGNVLDGQIANLLADGGLPVITYDGSDGKFYILRSVGGAIATSAVPALSDGFMENVPVVSANVEQSHTFPAGTKHFRMKARGAGRIQLSHTSGTSGSTYATVWGGSPYISPEFNNPSKTIYFQSPVAGLVIELESWV